jgi:hypothetical protein
MLRLVLALAVLLVPTAALAWGDQGHRLVTELALEASPGLPAFLRTPDAMRRAAEIAREPDRSRLAGDPHDADLDPGHYLKLDDEGRAIGGGPMLSAMPPTREGYERAFRQGDGSSYQAGFLYYVLAEGWQQLVNDLAYWRVLRAAERTAAPADRAWLRADRELREVLTLRDLGYWAHFVGDSTQPQHLSVHYDGWGTGPNPKGYTSERFHVAFEGPFVTRNVARSGVKASMRPAEACAAPINGCIARHLGQTRAGVEELYRLWGEGAIKDGDARGRLYAETLLGEAASRLRDYLAAAWTASGDAEVTFSRIKVQDAEAGKPIPLGALKGTD